MNERDLQVSLAIYLRLSCNNYDHVYTEYRVTLKEIEQSLGRKLTPQEYPWRSDRDSTIYIDIVVEKDGVFVPIELKYKTKALFSSVLPFGEPNPNNVKRKVLQNHGAQTDNRKLIMKDVARLQAIKKAFQNVVGGLVIFVTNDSTYWSKGNILSSKEDNEKIIDKNVVSQWNDMSALEIPNNPKNGKFRWSEIIIS
ncbi:MAG: hypothetical protein ACOYJG_10885 [Prevotella sp.]